MSHVPAKSIPLMPQIESILVAAMAAQTVLFSTIATVPPSARPFHAASPLFGQAVAIASPSVSSLKLVSKRPPVVVEALKKAVAVLKGTSQVEGVVALTQEDEGLFSPFVKFYLAICLISGLVTVYLCC